MIKSLIIKRLIKNSQQERQSAAKTWQEPDYQWFMLRFSRKVITKLSLPSYNPTILSYILIILLMSYGSILEPASDIRGFLYNKNP